MLLFNFQFVEYVGEQIQNDNRGAQMTADGVEDFKIE